MFFPEDPSKFDKRTLRQRLRAKSLTQPEIDAHLQSLPDEADEAEKSNIPFPPAVDSRNHR